MVVKKVNKIVRRFFDMRLIELKQSIKFNPMRYYAKKEWSVELVEVGVTIGNRR